MLAQIHIQKTAGQTIRAILRKSFGPAHCDLIEGHDCLADNLKWTARCYRRPRSIAGHAVRPGPVFREHFPEARYYTFLRAPLARCVSHYQYILQRGSRYHPFREWVEANADYQTRRLAGEPNGDKAIEVLETTVGFVGLVERFNESLVLWRKWTGEPGVDIGYRSVNVARSNAVKANVLASAQNRELIGELNREDEKLYRYVVEKCYPQQVAAYGDALEADVRSFEVALTAAKNWSWLGLLGKAKRDLLYKPTIRTASLRGKAA